MRTLLLGLLLLGYATSVNASPQRVACVGDSITYGSGLVDREHNAYPAQLGRLLGAGWQVRNFGVGSSTLSLAGDLPYAKSEAFRAARDWQADVIVILLGTNDTCQSEARRNWEAASQLGRDALRLGAELRGQNPQARVILCSPTPMFPEAAGLSFARQADLEARAPRSAQVSSVLRELASETPGFEFLDLSSSLLEARCVDGVHPDDLGALGLAQRLHEAILTRTTERLPLAALLEQRGLDLQRSKFHEYERLDFQLPTQADGLLSCRLVRPDVQAEGAPWIWRARFFGHQPELDLELLGRGYHLAYVEVGGLFGAEAALARWDRFYALCRELGLGPKPILEGMSRGGLVALNWAARHPGRLSAIYVDNPVCDFRSWPGGKTGQRSDSDWALCLAAYGLREEQAQSYARMPLDRLAPLAAAKVPIFLVLGSADQVVPPSENGELLAQRYLSLGGPLEVWRKPGAGHHPHGLHPVAPLLRSLLRAGGRELQPATQAMPSAEFRGQSAGWGAGTWWDQLARLRELAAQHPQAQVVFLGDSITQGLSEGGSRVSLEGGGRSIDRFATAGGTLNLGLSGDRTEHLLYRLEHGALSLLDPGLIVLMIGVNNVNTAGHTGLETAAGLSAVVESLLSREPTAKLILCGPFPTGPDPLDPRRVALERVHQRAAELANHERVHYLDLRSLFLDQEGRPNQNMRSDHVHLTRAGQDAWLGELQKVL